MTEKELRSALSTLTALSNEAHAAGDMEAEEAYMAAWRRLYKRIRGAEAPRTDVCECEKGEN